MKRVINKNRIFYFAIIVLIVIIVLATSVKVFLDFFVSGNNEIVTKNKLESLDLYGYTLDDLDTELYKQYFKELKDILNEEPVDMENYADVLTKLFVTDLYTLNNKVTSSDIGGVEFVHPNMVDNFKMNAGDTLYNHVKNNVYGDRVQELPQVKSVTVNSIQEDKYTYNDNEYEAYKVDTSWEYEKDMGYDTSGVFYLIKDNNKLNVVEKQEE